MNEARPAASARPEPPRLAEALRFWAVLGVISFGGPAGQIALMHAELVERRRWISESRFVHALNYCMLLPGPEAQQLATYLGWLLHRTVGGIAAGLFFVLPSFVILVGCAAAYALAGQTPWVDGLLAGIRPAVLALVLHAAWRLGRRMLTHPARQALALAAFGAVALLHLPFPLVIGLAALTGWLTQRRWPAAFAGKAHPASAGAASTTTHAPAVIDDDTPAPPHARFRRSTLLRVLAIGLLLWLVPLAVLHLLAQHEPGAGVLRQMALFFTQAALLTFGGAYAVLPYVHEGAVVQHGWVSARQMVDGLALGETTPGPLIMVVTFVGFLGGWQNASLLAWFGPEHRFAAGLVAATVVTACTFLPSFVFILAGGPFVETSGTRPGLAAPLSAIGAAVIGVIAAFALHLAPAVLHTGAAGSGIDPAAAGLTLAALGALLHGRFGAPSVILACGGAGLLLRSLG